MSDAIPVNRIKGVGEKTAALFGKINVYTVDDLIRHYPRDYETYGAPVSIRETSPGSVQAVYGQITAIPNVKKVRNLSILNAILKDDNGDSIQLTFFNMPFLKKVLKPGGFYLFRGLVQQRGTHKIMEQPRMFTWDEYRQKSGRLLPRYALTKGLTNQTVQKSVAQALEYYPPEKEYLPQVILQKYPMLSHREAVYALHFPESREELLTARNRMVFEEFFSFLLVLRKNKELAAKTENHFPMYETADTVRFLEQLPFPLTKAQKKVWGELREDMGSPYAMNRLIQGDVGSGKTIIAFLAMADTAHNGCQSAIMAPTEVLARQHYESFQSMCEIFGLDFPVILITGSMTAKQKKLAYQEILDHPDALIIGTHALIQEKVIYQNLALVITDEQHRFGVKQREIFSEKGTKPHILVMSATPIPRTLAIILYGDLDISVVDEVPAKRLPIKNCVVDTRYRPKAYQFIEKEVAAGHQAYVICPLVEESENMEAENVTDYAKRLKEELPDTIEIGLLHGQMKSAQKNDVMERFAANEIQVLVSTTVVEVGVNVPNATVMMIENAEHFGLAQLHQLRGRVGRGDAQSYCIMVNCSNSKESQKRLDILNQSNDGFKIASEDLKLRGPGDFFGIRQSGEMQFALADIYQDAYIMQRASEEVADILGKDPELSSEDHKNLKDYLELFLADQRNKLNL